jgi:hypothetical protein
VIARRGSPSPHAAPVAQDQSDVQAEHRFSNHYNLLLIGMRYAFINDPHIELFARAFL